MNKFLKLIAVPLVLISSNAISYSMSTPDADPIYHDRIADEFLLRGAYFAMYSYSANSVLFPPPELEIVKVFGEQLNVWSFWDSVNFLAEFGGSITPPSLSSLPDTSITSEGPVPEPERKRRRAVCATESVTGASDCVIVAGETLISKVEMESCVTSTIIKMAEAGVAGSWQFGPITITPAISGEYSTAATRNCESSLKLIYSTEKDICKAKFEKAEAACDKAELDSQ